MMKMKMNYGKINNNIDYYNENALYYYEESQRFNLEDYYNKFLKIANLKNNAKILDAGSGSGRDSVYFRTKGFEVISIDASESLVKISNENHNLNAEVKDLRDISYNKEFDAVWSCATLLHLKEEDFNKTLINLSNSLKDSGFLYFSIKKIEDNFYIDENNRSFYNVGIDKMHKAFKNASLELISYFETGKKTDKSQIFENYILKKVN